MSKEQSSEPNEVGGKRRDIFTHDQPIIVDGTGSVALEFDGTHSHAHYNTISGSVFTGVGLFISSVSVRVNPRAKPGSGTQCSLRTPFCTVAIESRQPQTQNGSIIRVRAIPGAIVISVDPVKFSEHSQNGNRKRLRNPAFRIESLTIRDVLTDEVIDDCTRLLPNNRKCLIDIIDDHILRDTDALAKRFNAQAE